MAHNTAKLGGAASDVVVAKVAVSYPTLFIVESLSNLLLSLIAWAYDDDDEANTCPR